MTIDHDPQVLKDMQDRGLEIKALYNKRNSDADAMVDMFMLRWAEEARIKKRIGEHTKYTLDASARDKLLGANRLLCEGEPQFSVPFDKNDKTGKKLSSKLERAAAWTLQQAGRVVGRPIHYDVVLSANLFAEVDIGITKTSDLVKWAAKGTSKASQMKAEEIAAITPYLFDVWDPRTCFPEFTTLGLTSFYREVATTAGRIRDEFGDEGAAQVGSKARTDSYTLCHYWDYQYRAAWILESNVPLIFEEHGLPFIPVVSRIVEGTLLFDNKQDQRQPFLYSLYKSGMWDRSNLALTVMYTNMAAYGSTPTLVYQTNDPEKELHIDQSTPIAYITIGGGESLTPLVKVAIDPSLTQGIDLADRKIQESTIYGQTLGQPIGGGNAPYAMVALLHQAGRLPLQAAKRISGWALADAMKIALSWWKHDGGKMEYRSYKDLKPADIPERFELECNLEIALPQDRLQMANTAAIISSGAEPLTSKRWARENVMGIGQSDEMQKEIWKERAGELRDQLYMQQQVQSTSQPPQQGQESMAAPPQGHAEGSPRGAPTPEQGALPAQMQGGGAPIQSAPGEELPV
jgi:hypothetical protein